ncbi:hypothetical protein OJE16_06745 [Pantoea tagorei]
MKLLVGAALLLTSAAANAGFVHPLDFDGSEAQKKEVISYIQKRVKADYCDGQLDMCQPTTLRMMEKQNLNAFKKTHKSERQTGVRSRHQRLLPGNAGYVQLHHA